MEFERWSQAMRGEFDEFLHETWRAMNKARTGYWIADTEEVMRQARDRLGRRTAPLGVRLKAGQSPDLIADDLGRFDVIALEFPVFTDGRAFSYARALRERHAFAGQVRAVGNVLRDQYSIMRRCGFDAFEVADGTRLEDWLESDREISVVYQQAIDGRPSAAALRSEKP